MKPCFLVVDKPTGVTSHDVVAAVRAVTGAKKVGHTGTLDPFATGVLPLALNSTRMIQFLDESIKVYDATIKMGEETDTGDHTGTIIKTAPVPTADVAEVERVLKGFVGHLMQTPPAYSAVKVKGKRLYEYARKGEVVKAEARPIIIHKMELTSYDHNSLRVLITCGRGTYARVLAVDIAEALSSCGHLSALQRVQSGPFSIENSISIEKLAEVVSAEPEKSWQDVLFFRGKREERVAWAPRTYVHEQMAPYLISPIRALGHLPSIPVSEAEEARIKNGGSGVVPRTVQVGKRFIFVVNEKVVAVAERTTAGTKLVKVL